VPRGSTRAATHNRILEEPAMAEARSLVGLDVHATKVVAAVVDAETGLEAAVRGQWPDGVDACLDTAGLGTGALGCVRDGGAFVTSVTTVPGAVPGAARGISPRTVAVQPDAAATAELADRAAKGELTLRVAETLPLERFRDAYTRLERGGLPGKVVLTP